MNDMEACPVLLGTLEFGMQSLGRRTLDDPCSLGRRHGLFEGGVPGQLLAPALAIASTTLHAMKGFADAIERHVASLPG